MVTMENNTTQELYDGDIREIKLLSSWSKKNSELRIKILQASEEHYGLKNKFIELKQKYRSTKIENEVESKKLKKIEARLESEKKTLVGLQLACEDLMKTRYDLKCEVVTLTYNIENNEHRFKQILSYQAKKWKETEKEYQSMPLVQEIEDLKVKLSKTHTDRLTAKHFLKNLKEDYKKFEEKTKCEWRERIIQFCEKMVLIEKNRTLKNDKLRAKQAELKELLDLEIEMKRNPFRNNKNNPAALEVLTQNHGDNLNTFYMGLFDDGDEVPQKPQVEFINSPAADDHIICTNNSSWSESECESIDMDSLVPNSTMMYTQNSTLALSTQFSNQYSTQGNSQFSTQETSQVLTQETNQISTEKTNQNEEQIASQLPQEMPIVEETAEEHTSVKEVLPETNKPSNNQSTNKVPSAPVVEEVTTDQALGRNETYQEYRPMGKKIGDLFMDEDSMMDLTGDISQFSHSPLLMDEESQPLSFTNDKEPETEFVNTEPPQTNNILDFFSEKKDATEVAPTSFSFSFGGGADQAKTKSIFNLF